MRQESLLMITKQNEDVKDVDTQKKLTKILRLKHLSFIIQETIKNLLLAMQQTKANQLNQLKMK